MGQAKRHKSVPAESPSGSRERRDLQINEDLPFQKRDWVAQRVGWRALALLLLAGLLGVMGSEPLSHVTATNSRGVSVEYERFVRHGAKAELTIRAAPEALTSDQARVAIDREYLSAQDLQRIVPEPSSTHSLGDKVEFIFRMIEDVPLVILKDGKPIREHMQKERVDEGDILEAARRQDGLERLDQIKYAILERTGQITIVPK